jgi:phage terminase large subunit-like protein
MPYPCVGGLDLSKTLDMTAFSLIFAVPDDAIGVRPYTWTWHWLPKPTAEKYTRFVDFFNPEWTKEETGPFLHLINQRTINYETVARRLEWVKENFDLRAVGYDTYNSSDICRHLMVDYGWPESMLVQVPQNMKYMGPITKEMERWIVRGEVHHPNNLLLNWQIQHVALDTDRLGNYRIMKPSKDDYRKVDGLVSLLIAGATLCSDPNLWTPDAGSILLYDRDEAEVAMPDKLTRPPSLRKTSHNWGKE